MESKEAFEKAEKEIQVLRDVIKRRVSPPSPYTVEEQLPGIETSVWVEISNSQTSSYIDSVILECIKEAKFEVVYINSRHDTVKIIAHKLL